MSNFEEVDLEKLTKADLETLGRQLEPSFEVDKRSTKPTIIGEMKAHVDEHEADLPGAWIPDEATDPDPVEAAEDHVNDFWEELEDLIHITRPLTPQQQYMTPMEAKFRAELHGRLKVMLENNPK